MFDKYRRPPGYVFVPAGNPTVTRQRRKLSEKIYAVYVRTPASRLFLDDELTSPDSAPKVGSTSVRR